ncbi:MAG: hypothetical protein WBB24_05605 [Maribacter sp.]
MKKCILIFFIWILTVAIASRMINSTEDSNEKELVDLKVNDEASLVVEGVQDKNR